MTEQLSGSVQKHEIEARTLPIKSITVYNDRAEVKRIVALKLSPGTNEVIVQNVSPSIDGDSVRVDGRGEATIHEVQFLTKPAIQADVDSPKIKQLESEKLSVEKKKLALEDRMKTWKRRVEVLDGVVGQVGNTIVAPPTKDDDRKSFLLNEETMNNMTKFFNFYESSSVEILQKIRDGEKEMRELQELINKLEQEINQLRYGRGYTNNISILLASEGGGEAELDVSYQVWNASWNPTYDIRVQMATDEKEKTTLTINYTAQIRQSTGEDWNEAALSLSTAQPSRGGTVPELPTLNAAFYRPPPPPVAAQMRSYGAAPPMMMERALDVSSQSFILQSATCMAAAPMQHAMAADEKLTPAKRNAIGRKLTLLEDDTIVEGETGQLVWKTEIATSDDHAIATSFTIARLATIPCDGAEHRVTVGVVQLSPRLLHETVPSKCPQAFLTAALTNTSAFAMLPGPANVYLNNSFVAKTQLKAISPGEEFTCSLGVDPSVKVEFKPPHKYHEQVGLLSRSASIVHEQKFTVKNTKQAESVTITLKEQIPKSTDEKIKVKILKPELLPPIADNGGSGNDKPAASSSHALGARLNPANILEWTVVVAPSKSAELIVKWSVEHPNGETIEYKEAQ